MSLYPFLESNLKPSLEGKKILIGITGSIAVYKMAECVRGLKQCGAEVKVIFTRAANEFVTPLTFETLSGNKVFQSVFESGEIGTHHIDLARWGDAFLIAPATANFIGKLAHGIADDLLLTELLAFRGKVLVAPAMNPQMYSSLAVKENVEKLVNRGIEMIGPDSGDTACGEVGLGRMSEVNELIERLARSFDLPKNGKKILITIGPTRSDLDPVRYLTNRSSGKMGVAFCYSALRRGYEVSAVCGPIGIDLPAGVNRISVKSASQMYEAVKGLWPSHDLFVGAAAVLDFDAKSPKNDKIKKSPTLTIDLVQTPDILAAVTQMKVEKQFVMGFAAESENVLENARAKKINKNCDAVFVNDIKGESKGFDSDFNEGIYLGHHSETPIPSMAKAKIADRLLQQIEGDWTSH